jgi:acyl carrier protein
MDRTEAERLIIEVLRDIQNKSGQQPTLVDRQTHPVGGLPGFDSVLAVEATVELEHRLGCEIPDVNLFVDEANGRTLSIDEIAKNLCRLLNSQEGTHDRHRS